MAGFGTPHAALTPANLATLLRQSGRQRNITAWANRLHETFRREQLRQLPDVEQALAATPPGFYVNSTPSAAAPTTCPTPSPMPSNTA